MKSNEHSFQVEVSSGQIRVGLQWMVSRPRAVVAIAHGIHEHIGRYRHVAATLNAAGYSVAGVDHLGHGRSAPAKMRTANIRRFDDFVDDYIAVIERLKSEHPEPLVALGHSMGGLVAARAALRVQDQLDALILSGPALMIPTDLSPWQLKIAVAIVRVAPFLKVPVGGIDGLSRDPGVRQRLLEDDMAMNQPVRLGMARQLLLLSEETRSRANELSLPLMVMHGSADQITVPAGSEEFVRNATSPNKEFVSWPGDMHEIFNELDQDAIIAGMIAWLDARIPAPN